MVGSRRYGVVGSVAAAWFLLVWSSLLGCGGGATGALSGDEKAARSALNVVSILYGEYLGLHNGAPPKDEAAFRQFLESRPDDLAMYNVKSVDELLKSLRDGQPLVIVTGKKVAPADSPDTPFAAYESQGVDGKRLAVCIRGGCRELTDDEVKQTFGGP